MLRKLIKHENAAVARLYLPMLAILAFMTLLTCIAAIPNTQNPFLDALPKLLMGLTILVIVAVFFGSIAIAVVRFYKSTMTGEGYLTFTLPAKTSSLINAKFIVAYMWMLISWLLALISLQLVLDKGVNVSIIKELDKAIHADFGEINVGALLGLIIAMFLVGAANQILSYYLSIALGQVLSRNKLTGSVAAYFVISFATQIIAVVIMLAATVLIGFDKIEAFANSASGIYSMFVLVAVILVLTGIVFYILTRKFLTDKLNLE